MTTSTPAIIWFRKELRLDDHPALSAAIRSGQPLVAVYVLDEESSGTRSFGGATRWWLHQSLEQLAGSIAELGGRLILRRGETVSVLAALAKETGADALFFTRNHAPADIAVENAVNERLSGLLELHRHGGRLLFEPERALKQDGTPYRVFTPFWKGCLALEEPGTPLPPPDRWPAPARHPASDALADWQLCPEKPDWAGGLRERWQAGEAGAFTALEAFLEHAVFEYGKTRDFPAGGHTSALSPYLHLGEISPRRVWHMTRAAAAQHRQGEKTEPFLRQLGWREFSHHLLFHNPELATKPLQPQFAAFPWRDDPAALERWQKGQTGYPIVDAGMRELWATGWMHNRVRMIVASFLIKDLLIPWQTGEAWFWDTLVDADPANNAASWQWVAGCGADAAPYFRIFNPSLQSKKFDGDGHYIRRWIPELADCPDKYLHEPWRNPDAEEQTPAYPSPIVDHAQARDRALAAYQEIRTQTG